MASAYLLFMCNASMAKRLVFSKLLWLLLIQSIFPCLHSRSCIGSERAALVSFKAVTVDPGNSLSSWEGEDCCGWRGVECSNRTGRVLSLDLAGLTSGFEGEISPALLHLKHLRRLDLSLIMIFNETTSTIPIPEFFGSFAHLRYLNLSRSGFSGPIPPQIGNLSRLHHLDLSGSGLSGQIPPQLGNLSRLLYLDLSGSLFLSGQIPPQLGNLSRLHYLDLSGSFLLLSHFSGQIPPQLGNLSRLLYLDLSGSHLSGQIPPQLGNLSRLLHLDLHRNELDANSLGWLQRLPSLKHLDLSWGNNLTAARDWIYMVNMLPSLTFLNLGFCQLDFIPSHLPYVNFTSLQTLDLGNNNFNDTLPRWFSSLGSLTHLILDNCSFYGPGHAAIGHLTSLESLDLGNNHFYGPVPDAIGNNTSLVVLNLQGNNFDGRVPSFRNLCSLEGLYLSSNKFSGEDMDEFVDMLPNCTERRLQTLVMSSNRFGGRWTRGLEQMANLHHLDLSHNQINGLLPAGIGKLSRLTYIDLSGNSFEGVVTEAHFANLTSLRWLILSDNHLTISIDGTWAPPFQLRAIALGSCHVGPSFPAWLQQQTGVSKLDLSGSGISGAVPGWFWTKFAPKLDHLDLSNNQIRGTLPESLQFGDPDLVFRSFMFHRSLQPTLPNARTLDLSDNHFSGPLPSILEAPDLSMIDLSGNLFNSNIPSSWSSLSELRYLDLSDNHLSGEIVWPQSVEYINLGGNHLAGSNLSSLGSLSGLKYLGLSNTGLSGPFPASLRTCKGLVSLDLSHNKVSGIIPTWLAESFPSLSVLLLRSNMFSGIIPPRLTQLHSLQILDLADNNLSGPIPRHLCNLTSMASTPPEGAGGPDFVPRGAINKLCDIIVSLAGGPDHLTCGPENPDVVTGYYSSAVVFTKGEALAYTKNRYLVRSFDLSNNHLSGEIPEEIVSLAALINLNLSANRLEGKIPEKIGSLKALESLDLSRNRLSGNIPLGVSSLDYLSRLNLSYNRLSGRIPSGNQLQTLNDTSIYEGNPDLCGPPLPKSCPSNTTYNVGHDEDDDDVDERVWLYIGMGPGYVAGFWTVCGALLLKKRWRYAYFRFIDDVFDRLYVAVSLSLARAKRAWMRHGN